MTHREHVSLAPLTTFDIGGEARFFVEAHTEEEVRSAIVFAREHGVPLFVLGGGSNIVVSDDGFDGVVLSLRATNSTYDDRGDHVMVTVDAGVTWDDLVADTTLRGYAGLECLSGVPGTVGGAVVANIGAYGAQCSDTFVSAEAIDLKDADATRIFKKDDCHFAYHDSVFGREPGRYIIMRATFKLTAKTSVSPAYQDHRFNLAALASGDGALTLNDVRNAVLDIREEKGALWMEGRLSYNCAGSFFHMPFVSAEQYALIVARARDLDAEKEERLRPWAWEQSDGSYKLAPGFLLEYTEFQKGYVRDTVGISPKHTLTIINVDRARATDVAQLARDMQQVVETIFDVHLEREVEYIGHIE